MFHFQAIDGMGWCQETGLWGGVEKIRQCSNLINNLFSRDIGRFILTKVNIDVFVNEAHPNSKLCLQGWGGVKK